MKATQLVSLETARQLGLRFYFTGNPCSKNHIAKRYVASRACIECHKEHSRSNPNRLIQNRASRVRQRRLILNKLGNKCAVCGIDDFRVLQVDHVNGGGRKDMETFTSRNKYYKSI